jgi:putative tricarboxylic transport membrane protein
LLPNIPDLIKSQWVLLWSAVTGFFVGVLPGLGGTAATMLTYAIAKKSSRNPSEFGTGAIQGVAAPEAANNGASYGAMIPLFTLGIPGSATTAVLFGGLLMIGLQPGPRLFVDNADFVWTVFGTFWIGNLMLVVLTSLLIPFLARIVFISTAVLYPIVFALVTFGVYSINYSMGDVTIALIAGVVGYIMLKLDYAPVPLVLGLVLGPLVERGMRRTLILSEGDISVFTERPIALTFLLMTVAVIVVPLIVNRFRPVTPSSL